MQLVRRIILTLVFIGVFILPITNVMAQTPTPTATVTQAVSGLEILQKELKLNFETITDDITPVLTFVVPSSKELKITLDDKPLDTIKSPLTLPTLQLGKHTLRFEYTNDKGIPRSVVIEFVVVPPGPIINTQKTLFIKPEPLKIEGTALPNAQVLIIVNSTKSYLVDVDNEGRWSFILDSTVLGEYNILVYTYRDGLISKNYETITLQYKLSGDEPSSVVQDSNPSNENIDLKEKLTTTVQSLKANPTYLWGGISALSGLVLLTLFGLIRRKIKRKTQEEPLARLLQLKPDIFDKDKKKTGEKNSGKTKTQQTKKTSTTKTSNKSKKSPSIKVKRGKHIKVEP